MITHEEAKNICDDMELELEESVILETYFTQQEQFELKTQKEHELLGLYRNFQYHVYSGNVAPRDRLNDKIQKLEKELGEMK